MLNDLSSAVYKAFNDALSGKIKLDGAEIPIFSLTADTSTLPEWVFISQFEQNPSSTKLNFGSRCSLLLSIYIAGDDMMRAAAISNIVLNTLYSSKIAVVDIESHPMVVLNEPNVTERTVYESDRIYSVKDIRLQMLIYQ